jgi:L-alanine-DL-glutamate epimerase-like enolase superfamily enzyme
MSDARPDEERSAEVVHTHVHSLRLASGAEALVARVQVAGAGGRPVAGLGFTLNDEAIVARDMAYWDAAARARGLPLHALFGPLQRASVEVCPPQAGAPALDPWQCLTLRALLQAACSAGEQGGATVRALLAPNAHPWELAWCTALAGLLPAGAWCIRSRDGRGMRPVPLAPGHDIDWSLEPGFAALDWQSLEAA